MYSALNKAIRGIGRKYENLWLAREDLDVEFDNFKSTIDDASHFDLNKDIFISNVNKYPHPYLYSLKSLLRTARSDILIFSDNLDQTLDDGTLLFSDPQLHEINNIIIELLDRSHTNKVAVIFRHPITREALRKLPLFNEVIKRNGFKLYWARDDRVAKCKSRCVIVDKKAYSFRIERFSWVNFNNPDRAGRLSLSIEKALRLPTTYALDDESIRQLAAA